MKSFFLLPVLFLAACATHRTATHYQPLSVQPVTTHVQRAQESVAKAQTANTAATTAITTSKQIAEEILAKVPQLQPEFVKLEAQLDEAQTQLKSEHDLHIATTTDLEQSLENAKTLQGQVDASEKEKLKLQDKSDADDKTISKQKAANDKLSREVWIYKGGVIIFFMALVIGLAAFQIVRSGVLVKIVAATAGFVWWLWLIVAGAVAALLVGWFWLLWKWLP